MKYELKSFNRNITDNELLDDLKKVAANLGRNSLSSREYDDNEGKFTSGTIGLRFSGWNNALIKADLQVVHQRDVLESELFNNLEEVWIKIGRQPVFRDLNPSISKYSARQYITKFGTWLNALKAFVEYINSDTLVSNENKLSPEISSDSLPIKENIFVHKTKRLPSERLKVQVLMRDGNKCRLCGITLTGNNIHFDHIIPWSKGGETVLENIQVLCAPHNLAKGNLTFEANNELEIEQKKSSH